MLASRWPLTQRNREPQKPNKKILWKGCCKGVKTVFRPLHGGAKLV